MSETSDSPSIPQVTVRIHVGQDYASQLKDRLEKKRVTQRELADETGIDKTAISRLLAGRSAPTMKTVERIEVAFAQIMARRKSERLERP